MKGCVKVGDSSSTGAIGILRTTVVELADQSMVIFLILASDLTPRGAESRAKATVSTRNTKVSSASPPAKTLHGPVRLRSPKISALIMVFEVLTTCKVSRRARATKGVRILAIPRLDQGVVQVNFDAPSSSNHRSVLACGTCNSWDGTYTDTIGRSQELVGVTMGDASFLRSTGADSAVFTLAVAPCIELATLTMRIIFELAAAEKLTTVVVVSTTSSVWGQSKAMLETIVANCVMILNIGLLR